jgi:hypothetical protein
MIFNSNDENMPEHKIGPNTPAGRRLTDDEIHGLLLDVTNEADKYVLEQFYRAMPEELGIANYDELINTIAQTVKFSSRALLATMYARITLWPEDADIMYYMIGKAYEMIQEKCTKCEKDCAERTTIDNTPDEDTIKKAVDDMVKFSNEGFKLDEEPPETDEQVH